MRTAQLMLEGATTFAPLLDRWIGFDDRQVLSTPFYYAVHRGSMVEVDRLRAHYAGCKRVLDEMHAARGATYLGMERTLHVEQMTQSAMEQLISGDYFEAMFRTNERAVDPRTLATLLRAAIRGNPRIRFTARARVSDVAWLDRGAIAVTFEKDGQCYVEEYDQVANTLWHGRLSIDARIGLQPEIPWMHRYKFANRVHVPLGPGIPSITCVLGPFGDIVNYGANGLFLSWYPEGMIGTSFDLQPPDWHHELTPERRHQVFQRSHAEWMELCPLLRSLDFSAKDVDPGGGVIFAWGNTDIDDQNSRLHDRYDVGVYSVRNYHTVNTGKYTLAPLMGMRTADRILGVA